MNFGKNFDFYNDSTFAFTTAKFINNSSENFPHKISILSEFVSDL